MIVFQIACMAVSVLLFYFNMAVVSWMLVEGLQLYMQVVVVINGGLQMKMCLALGWGKDSK